MAVTDSQLCLPNTKRFWSHILFISLEKSIIKSNKLCWKAPFIPKDCREVCRLRAAVVVITKSAHCRQWPEIPTVQLYVGSAVPLDPQNRNGVKQLCDKFSALWFMHVCRSPKELPVFVSLFIILKQRIQEPVITVPLESRCNRDLFSP